MPAPAAAAAPPRPAFTGFPEYLARAAEELGLPRQATDDARRQPAVGHVASLVAQAVEAQGRGGAHPDTLRKLRELRDALAVAARAAQLMVQVVDPEPAARPPGRGPK